MWTSLAICTPPTNAHPLFIVANKCEYGGGVLGLVGNPSIKINELLLVEKNVSELVDRFDCT